MIKPWDHLREKAKPPIRPGTWTATGGADIQFVKQYGSGRNSDLELKIGGHSTNITVRSWKDFRDFLNELLDQPEFQ